MIPRLNRLPTTRLVSSKVINSEYFTLRFLPNNLSCNRFAFVVSKKIDKRAVVRNRLKRILREVACQQSLSFKGIDMLFIVRKYFASSVEIEKIVQQTLSYIHP